MLMVRTSVRMLKGGVAVREKLKALFRSEFMLVLHPMLLVNSYLRSTPLEQIAFRPLRNRQQLIRSPNIVMLKHQSDTDAKHRE
jgi:hypothetical protein